MDPNPDMIEDLPLKMKGIKMLNRRKYDNKSVCSIQNFNIEWPQFLVKIFFVKLENFEKISKIAKTQDFERI